MAKREFWAALDIPGTPLKDLFIECPEIEGDHLYLADEDVNALKQKVDAFRQELLVWESGKPQRVTHNPKRIVFYVRYKDV